MSGQNSARLRITTVYVVRRAGRNICYKIIFLRDLRHLGLQLFHSAFMSQHGVFRQCIRHHDHAYLRGIT